ncbi:MAG TPA: hypothetical protein VNI82_00375 [Candidatus Nitrosotenuis sp.]|nr:hypothetical protein [Candidatus Nitrosotenuis sp.]
MERITEQERRESVRRESIAQLRQLKDEVPDFTVAFLNTKGAAATTTTAVHTASVVGDITRSVLLLLDANPASGTSAARLGKDRGETLTVGGLNDEFEMMNTFKRFIRKISPTRYSVRPVSSDSVVTDDRDLESMEMSKLLGGLQANSEYLFVDTANVITNKTSLAVVSAADVLVFTANVAVHDSLRQLGTTMETLRRRGFVDKVNNSVVVISNLPPGADLDDYRKFQHDVNLRDKVTKEYPGHIGSFMSVPYDLLITRDQEVDLGALNWETFQAYLEIGIAIFSQAKLLAHG